jgi:hypothetical protein
MDASTLTQRRKNQVVYANGLNRYATIANGCRPFLPPAINGASMGGYLVPVLVGGKVCIPCSEATDVLITTPACSSATSSAVVPVFNCDYSSIPGLTVHLDANDPLGTGVLPANGAGVATWKDLALPGANDAVKPASGVPSPPFQTFNPPTFQLVSQNGLPGIQFTNGGASPFQGLVINAPVSSANYSIFMVGRFTGALVGGNPIISGATTQPALPAAIYPFHVAHDRILWSGKSSFGTFYSANVLWPTPPTTLAANTSYIFTFVPASGISGINGNDAGGGTIPTPDVNLALGMEYDPTKGATTKGSAGTNCVINQLLIYNRVVTPTERRNIEVCLSKKWGITLY